MTTSDVHVPAFDPTTTSVTTRATAPGSYYHPCFQPSTTTTTTTTTTTHPTTTTLLLNSTTDPSLYSLTHGSHYPQQQQHLLQQQPLPLLPLQQYPQQPLPPYALANMPSDLSSVSSSSTSSSNTSFSIASAATSTTTVTPEDDEKPCEKYRQFLHSTRQERTVVIDKLVEVSAEIIDSIWNPARDCKVVSTRNFIHEILKRSKATYSTLQISLFYLFRVKKRVHDLLQTRHRMPPSPPLSPPREGTSGHVGAKKNRDRMEDMMLCGRRMFLASLMVASKYLQDKNYRNRAWAKIAGLDLKQVNTAELAFLRLIDYKLHISKPTFDKWYTLLHGYLQKKQQQEKPSSACSFQIKMDSV